MQVQGLYFLPGPGRFAQEFQAGLDAGLVLEAIDVNILRQPLPAVHFDQMFEDGLQGYAVEGIVGLWLHDAYALYW